MTPLCKIFANIANLQDRPGIQTRIGRRSSQMLHGETFEIHGTKGHWVFGQSVLDGYEGWISKSKISFTLPEPTHAVTKLTTNAYSTPDFKTYPTLTFSFMARVTPDPESIKNGFVKLQDRNLWIPKNHLTSLDTLFAEPADIIETAKMFSNTPYLYGGRSASGIDCSALVQIAMQRNGIFCPRDADQQERQLGVAVTGDYQRGDIIFFNDNGKVHVGIMTDSTHVLNANIRTMGVEIEKLDDMIIYYGQSGMPAIKSVRRLQV